MGTGLRGHVNTRATDTAAGGILGGAARAWGTALTAQHTHGTGHPHTRHRTQEHKRSVQGRCRTEALSACFVCVRRYATRYISYQVQGLLCGELLLVEGRDERLLVAHVEALHDAMKNEAMENVGEMVSGIR